MRKLIVVFIFISINLYGQLNLDQLSIDLMNEFNKKRESLGLKKFIWNDNLLNFSKKTNSILENSPKLYHPEYSDEYEDSIHKELIKDYKKLTNRNEFDSTKFKGNYKFNLDIAAQHIGEICLFVPTDLISVKYIANVFYNSKPHFWWLKIPNSCIRDDKFNPYFSCHILHDKKNNLYKVTCNMYTINLFLFSDTDWYSLD